MESQKNVTTFEYMIASGLWKYHCDPWMEEPMCSHFQDLESDEMSGQVNYKGETFVVNKHSGNLGLGGMDMGRPESYSITRIAQ